MNWVAVVCASVLLALAAAFALGVYTMVTLPPLSCTPKPHAAIQLNCVHGHLAP